MRLIHFSDFHLNEEHKSDWNDYVKESLYALLQDIPDFKWEDTFVICTGDIIDQGGADCKSIDDAFIQFRELVVNPLISDLDMPQDHFIMVPGNHDIDRCADTLTHAEGLRVVFQKNPELEIRKKSTKILEENDREDVARMMSYKAFEHDFYKDYPNVHCTYLGSTFRYKLENGITIGFAGFNTAWCSYDNNDKQEGIVLGEEQYNRCKREIADCDVKVALMHHPLDWLKYEQQTTCKFLTKDFSFLCVGHIHEGDSSLSTGMNGTLFTNIAPSFESDIRKGNGNSFANGLTIIDYNIQSDMIVAEFYVYNLSQRKFIRATNLIDNGTMTCSLNIRNTTNVESVCEAALKYIKGSYYVEIDEALIPQKANRKGTLRDVFVMLKVEQNGVYHSVVGLSDLMQRRSHYMLLGPAESGRTTLLHRIFIEYVDYYSLFHLIPIYVDFNSIGNQDFITIVKSFLDVSSTQAKSLLTNGRLILLLDNLEPIESNYNKIAKLKQFMDAYNVRVICTGTASIGLLPEAFISKLPIAFEFYFINNFEADKIRDMISKWSPSSNALLKNQYLDDLVNHFVSYSLPCTAFSVSLYLWTTDGATNKPINRAVLLDMYIECVLEKMNLTNVYRDTFNYGNKTSLIAFVAYRMDESHKVSIPYSTYLDILREYLQRIGVEQHFDYIKLGDYFIEQKIFTKKDNLISFAHSCFFHFFLAKYMTEDEKFRAIVFSPSKFYLYMDAIDYYTGLNRKEQNYVDFIFKQFEEFFAPAKPIYDEVNVDNCFTYLVKGQKVYVPLAERIDVKELIAHKNTQDEIDQKQNTVCNERINQISDNLTNNSFVTPDKMIVFMAHVLRNSEELDLSFKSLIYNSLIKNVIIFLIAHKENLARYANSHNGELPPSYVRVQNVRQYFKYLPYAMQIMLQELIGTKKLSKAFEKKLQMDYAQNKYDIEKFLTMGLLWDTLGVSCAPMMRKFIKSLGKNSCQDYVFQKLYYIFNNKIQDDSAEEDIYLRLLTDIYIKQKRLGALKKGFVYRDFKQTREDSKRKHNNK